MVKFASVPAANQRHWYATHMVMLNQLGVNNRALLPSAPYFGTISAFCFSRSWPVLDEFPLSPVVAGARAGFSDSCDCDCGSPPSAGQSGTSSSAFMAVFGTNAIPEEKLMRVLVR